MKEYIMGAVTVVLAVSVIMSLVPRSGTSGTMKLLCGLCTVCAVVFPLTSLFGDGMYDTEGIRALFEQEKYDEQYYVEIYNKYFTEAEVSGGEIYLKSQVSQELGLDNEDFDLNVILSDESDEISIDTVEIIIYASGLDIDPHSVEKYIISRLNCKCTVIYEL